MHDFSLRKYKDSDPIHTVNKIRSILTDMNIFTVEKMWKISLDKLYSVNINIVGTNMGTNGKGISYEYALASGYAELMERLQNQALYTFRTELSQELLNYQGFRHAPDEVFLSQDDILRSNENYLRYVLYNAPDDISRLEIIGKWLYDEDAKQNRRFVSVPFYDVDSGNLCHIPVNMLHGRYATNGMCAGNTPEEALVQGISEVFERYVNLSIIRDNITPPTIPEEYLKRFTVLFDIIRKIESRGNFKIIIKDCSLGKGFPVVGLILINRDLHTYFVKFGSHIVFEIALERALTELLQGKDLNNVTDMSSFSMIDEWTHKPVNLERIFINGCGIYPQEFFKQSSSYPFSEFSVLKEYNNWEFLHRCLEIIKRQGLRLLVRDVSFLGFPSYHVIIPGISECMNFTVNDLEYINQFKQIRKILRKINRATAEELNLIIRYLEERYYLNRDIITPLLDLPLNDNSPWNMVRKDLFIGSAYYKMGKLRDAYIALDRFINYMDLGKKEAGLSYYKCARDYIEGIEQNVAEKDLRDLLSIIYQEEIVNKVMTDLKNPKEIFKYYGELDCWNCTKCSNKCFCSYETIIKIHKKIKDIYKNNSIDQMQIARIFDKRTEKGM